MKVVKISDEAHQRLKMRSKRLYISMARCIELMLDQDTPDPIEQRIEELELRVSSLEKAEMDFEPETPEVPW